MNNYDRITGVTQRCVVRKSTDRRQPTLLEAVRTSCVVCVELSSCKDCRWPEWPCPSVRPSLALVTMDSITSSRTTIESAANSLLCCCCSCWLGLLARHQFPVAAARYLVISRELHTRRESWLTSGQRARTTMSVSWSSGVSAAGARWTYLRHY